MSKLLYLFPRFSRLDLTLWGASVLLILLSFFLFSASGPLTLTASLLGVTSLIYCAKGHPFGQVLMLVFSVLYGILSYSAAYYGEMLTYLGMTAPMAAFSLVSWVRNPSQGNRAQVAVAQLHPREAWLLPLLTAAVTVLFYYVLRAFDTAQLAVSTLSVATSFVAAYLTFRRSPYYALAYAANDLVLVVLWALAARNDPSSLSVLLCFAIFLVNDLYGFVSWKRMQRQQSAAAAWVSENS